MIAKSRKARRNFFERSDQPDQPDQPFKLRPCPTLPSHPSRTLSEIIGINTGGPGGSRKDQPGHSKWDYLMFLQLVQSCLVFDPLERITPLEALHMGFFRSYSDSAT